MTALKGGTRGNRLGSRMQLFPSQRFARFLVRDVLRRSRGRRESRTMSDFLKSSSAIDGRESECPPLCCCVLMHVCPAVLELGSSSAFDAGSVCAAVSLSSQASLSLPGSPYDKRRGSQYSVTWARNDQRYGDRIPLVLQNLDQESDVPFADESVVGTPNSEECSALLAGPPSAPHSRHSSYTSHSSRISYTSHGDVCGPRGNGPLSWTRDKSRRCFHEVRYDLLLLAHHFNHWSHSSSRCTYRLPINHVTLSCCALFSPRILSSTLRNTCSLSSTDRWTILSWSSRSLKNRHSSI